MLYDFKTQQKYSLRSGENPIGNLCLISIIFAFAFDVITHNDMKWPIALCILGYIITNKETIQSHVLNVYHMIKKYEQLLIENQRLYKHQENIATLQKENERLISENELLKSECQKLKSNINAQHSQENAYLYAMRGILIRNKDKLTDEIIVHNDDGYDDPYSYIIDIELLKYPKIGHYKATRLSG